VQLTGASWRLDKRCILLRGPRQRLKKRPLRAVTKPPRKSKVREDRGQGDPALRGNGARDQPDKCLWCYSTEMEGAGGSGSHHRQDGDHTWVRMLQKVTVRNAALNRGRC